MFSFSKYLEMLTLYWTLGTENQTFPPLAVVLVRETIKKKLADSNVYVQCEYVS